MNQHCIRVLAALCFQVRETYRHVPGQPHSADLLWRRERPADGQHPLAAQQPHGPAQPGPGGERRHGGGHTRLAHAPHSPHPPHAVLQGRPLSRGPPSGRLPSLCYLRLSGFSGTLPSSLGVVAGTQPAVRVADLFPSGRAGLGRRQHPDLPPWYATSAPRLSPLRRALHRVGWGQRASCAAQCPSLPGSGRV